MERGLGGGAVYSGRPYIYSTLFPEKPISDLLHHADFTSFPFRGNSKGRILRNSISTKFVEPPTKRHTCTAYHKLKKLQTPWPESASELYRPSDLRLSTKLVPTFADIGCHVVSVTDPYCCILGFQDRSRYFFFQVAPQLYSRGWVGPVPDPLLLRKSGSAKNRTRTSRSVVRNSDH
jgi:hypothetical protein